MILSDKDIRWRIELRAAGGPQRLLIEPVEDFVGQLQPASFDLRLDNTFRVYDAKSYLECNGRVTGGVVHLDRKDGNPEMEEVAVTDRFHLHPGAFVLGTTIERVRLPNDLVARVEGRSSFGRLGLMIHATAGFIDPGFDGQITLEFTNVSPNTIVLKPGIRICQLSFHQMSSPAERPYGAERGSKYQNQRGPTASRIHEDTRT